MQHISNEAEDLIIGHLGGSLSETEKLRLAEWLAADPSHKLAYEERRELWTAATTPEALRRYDADAAFRRFWQKTRALGQHGPGSHSVWLRWRYAAAAVALAALAATAGFWAGGRDTRLLAEQRVEVQAPEGSIAQATLPDGTHVWLNAGSRLVCGRGYGLDSREVSLRGEAYFVVKHDAAHPFAVSSQHATVRVLGTEFNFSDRDSDTAVVVTLARGSVALTAQALPGQEWRLKPGQRAVLCKRHNRVRLEGCDTEESSQWRSGIVSLGGRTMAEIAVMLSRQYNVRIVVGDTAVAHRRFYGEFARQGQSITDVMDALQSTGRLRYRVSGRTIMVN